MLHVSDRLVTRGQHSFDPLANKSILYCANNGILAMAYTGMAFLGEVATDQWLADVLIGNRVESGPRLPVFSLGPTKSVDVGRALIKLTEALNNAPVDVKLRAHWIAQSFDVLIVGWQWTARRRRPIIASICKETNSTTFRLAYRERYWFYERRGSRFLVGAGPAVNFRRAAIQDLCDRLANRQPDEAEMMLVGAVRDTARRIAQVGPHCMSILIMPPNVGSVRIRYLPLGSSANALLGTSEGKTLKVPVAYPPWIVGPNLISAPSVLSGGMELFVGPYTVVLEAPDPPGPLLSYAGGRDVPLRRDNWPLANKSACILALQRCQGH
jgi:hypothetical protein